MVVRSVKNQYLGINAHLHSLWQAEGGWPEFHTRHIVHLADALKPLLLPIGYTAAIESALQIRRLDLPGHVEYPESDVTIYDLNPSRPLSPPSPVFSSGAVGELVFPITETLLYQPIAESEYRAVKIYDTHSRQGEPVVWIELLSPSNKPGGRDVREYIHKREKVIESGIVFIELDYLHESPSTLPVLPDYRPPHEQSSHISPHPYHIVIIDPRPAIQEGIVRVIGFDVDQPIPGVKIMLNAGDELECTFNAPYHKTIEDALYGLEWVDYQEWPLRFDRYREADQTRIANRMLAVLKAAQAQVDLETGLLTTETLTLDEARRQIERMAIP